MSPSLSLQLYSLRRETVIDALGTLQKISGIGYDSVELAGDYGWSVEEWKRVLVNTGLTISGAHVGLNSLRDDYAATVKFHKALATPWIIVPSSGEEFRSAEGWPKLAAELNQLGVQLKRDGFRLAYHNHAFEFAETTAGKCGLEILMEESDPELVSFEVDTYWVHKGGRDALQFIKEHADSIALIHAKELRISDGADVPAGQGNIDFKNILALAKERSWPVVVEFEGENAMAAVEASAKYLRTLW